jgi:hypothetical protein
MEDQALTTFNHAAEEMRSLRDHQWLITNYAVIAYAALVGAPKLVPHGSWRFSVSLLAIVLVVTVAFQAWRTLEYSTEIRVLEHARLKEAIEQHLPVVREIHQKHPPKQRAERPPWVWMPQWLLAYFFGEDDFPRFPWGLLVVVLLGAVFATVIIISRSSR